MNSFSCLVNSFIVNCDIQCRYLFAADCPRATCNHADDTREKPYKIPIHSLISPRLLKSQPYPGNATETREIDHRLVQSQPVPYSGSPRFVCINLTVGLNNFF